MKFKSPVYSQVSGSIAGLTYAHTAGVLYSRQRSIPVNPNTAPQQLARAAVATLSADWNSLTQAQRDDWTTYAAGTPITNKLGDPLTLSGQQMFIRCNSPRIIAGIAIVEDAPLTLGLANFTPVTLGGAAGAPTTLTLTYTNTDAWAGEVGGALLLFGSRPQSPGTNFFRGPFFYVGKVAGAATPPTPPLVTDLQSTNATPVIDYPSIADQRVFARVMVVRADGRISGPQLLTAIVA